MNLFLDDIRMPPSHDDDWVKVTTVESCIDVLKNNFIDVLSLDHDLGTEKTGYDVLLWIEKCFDVSGICEWPEGEIIIHTQNIVGRDKMVLACKSMASKFVNEDIEVKFRVKTYY